MIVGVDLGAPRRARDQRRKIIALAAQATEWRRYRIDATGMNARLLANDPPGWSAEELADELVARPVRVAAFDFPFCVPASLLDDREFAAAAGYEDGTFHSWRSFNWHVARQLPFTDPLDFGPFAAWRNRADRARLWTKRSTDIAARGQPPLKDKFQHRVLPSPGGRGGGEVIEVYPGATLRRMGLVKYKSRPEEAVRLGIAACAAAGIKLDVDLRLVALCCRYSSGGKTPDYDVADAFVALCTAILYAEGECRPAIDDHDGRWLKEREGAIWVPAFAASPGVG